MRLITEAYQELIALTEEARRRDPWELMPILDKWLKGRGWKLNSRAPHWALKAWFKPAYQERQGDPWAKLRAAFKNLAPKVGGQYIEQQALADEPDTVRLVVPGYFTVTAELPNTQFAVAKILVSKRK